MKLIVDKFWIRTLIVVLCVVGGVVPAWAGHDGPHYAKVTVTAAPTGSGKVYMTTDVNKVPASEDWKPTMSEDWNCDDGLGPSENDNRTYYVHAQAESGYHFVKWSSNSSGTDSKSTDNPYAYSTSASSTSSGSPTQNNIYAIFEANPQYTCTFLTSTNGTYKYQSGESAEVTVTSEHSVTTDQNFTFTALPDPGYQVYGWYTESGGVKTYFDYSSYVLSSYALPGNIRIGVDFMPVGTPIFQIKGTTQMFTDLNAAVTACGNQTKTIVLVNNGTLPAGEYTIPSNITLLIPFDANYTCYTETPGTIDSYTFPAAYRTLTMSPGARLIVNGKISLSAKVSGKSYAGPCGAPSESYGAIKMLSEGETKSTITLNNGAKLYSWGYIYGEGAVEVLSGAEVHEGFAFMDFRGAQNTYDMNSDSHKVFPFNQYYIQNIEVPLTIHYGATEKVFSCLYPGGNEVKIPITMVGSSDGLFRLSGEGSKLTKWYDPHDDRQHYALEGNAAIRNISFTVTLIMSITVNSANFVLPITNNMDITVRSGANVDIAENVCIMPDASITVEEGATLNIASGKNVYVYDKNAYTNAGTYTTSQGGYPDAGPGRYAAGAYVRCIAYSPSWATIPDREIRRLAIMHTARFKINGTVNVNGAFYTTEGGADIYSDTEGATINLVGAAGTANVTYQVDHQNYDAYYYSIPITSAQLHNADQSYAPTAGSPAGAAWTYKHGHWGWKVVWMLEDGTVLKTAYHYAQPDASWISSNAPSTDRADEGTCSYSFNGWNTTTNTENQEVTVVADYSKTCMDYYTVTWMSEDGTETLETDEQVGQGENTRYNGAMPFKPFDTESSRLYTFDGWATEPNGAKVYDIDGTPAASGDAIYYAHFAVTEVVAIVKADDDTTYCTSIEEAFEVVRNTNFTPTIQVWKDASIPALVYNIENYCTLDLNGHTLTSVTSSVQSPFTINKSNITFTITDSSESQSGKLSMTSTYGSTIFGLFVQNGNLQLSGGTIEVISGSAITCGVTVNSNCSFTMNGGKIHVVTTNNKEGRGIYSASTVLINDGTVHVEAAGNAYAIRRDGGTVTVNGGKFNINGSSSYINYGASADANIAIKGGYYSTDNRLATVVPSPYIVYDWASPGEPYLYTVAAKVGYTVTFQNTDGTPLQTGTWVEGTTPAYAGETPTKPGDTEGEWMFDHWTPDLGPVTEDVTYTAVYAPTPPVASVTISGTTTEYIHFADAWSAVNTATDASTLTLLQDVTVTTELTYNNSNNKNCTLNLNGHTLTSNTSQQSPLQINNTNVTFTITDGTENKSGKLSLNTSSSSAIFGVYVKYGAFRLEGGTIEVNSGSAATHGVTVHFGTFTMNGGTIHVKATNGKDGRGIYANSTTIINGGTVHVEAAGTACGVRRDGGTITINGGKFNIYGSTASYMNYKEEADSKLIIKGGYYTINNRLATYVSAPYHVFGLTSGAEFDEGYRYKVAEGYNVTFNANGHGSAPEAQLIEMSARASEPTAPTAEGYTFGGWYKEAGCETPWNFASDGVTAATTLFAKWTAINYSISYDLVGGSVASENPTSYTLESGAITLNNPTKDGYIFSGWTGTGLGSATINVTISAGSTGDRSYTATWTPAVASVTINEVTTYYTTFDDAWSAVNSATAASTIQLLQNVSVTSYKTYNNANTQNCTFDLNGHTLSSTTAMALLYIYKAGITFTITDLTESKSGTLHLESTSTDNRWCVYVAKGNLQMDAGTVFLRSKANTYNEGIRIDPAASTFTMNGGKVHVETSDGKPACGIVSRGIAVIRGGEIQVEASGTGYGIEARVSDDGNNIGNVTVYGGKFLVTGTTAACAYRSNANATLKLQGGYYNSDTDLSTYCATNYHVFPNDDATYLYKVAEGYTVTFKNEDETLQSGLWEEGATPLYSGETPAKAADAQYTYTFNGWNVPIAPVTANVIYTAQFSSMVNTYTVTWKNEDGTTLETDENVPYGTTPTYDGATPTKPADASYAYTFNGWSPAVGAITGTTEYTATYTTTPVVASVTVSGVTDYYTTFDAAWDAATGAGAASTITLLDDITGLSASRTYSAAHNLTLDLNGHTLSGAGTSLFQISCTGYTFTVTDGSANHNGKLLFTTAESSTSSFHCVIVNNGTFVLEAGTIEATSSTVSIGAVQVTGGTFTMNENGAVHANYTGNVAGKNSRFVHANGGTTTINGGTIHLESTKDGIGVVYGSGNVTFNGGKFKIVVSGTAAVTNKNSAQTNLNIRGGYYSANDNTYFTPHVKTPYHIFANADAEYPQKVAEGYTVTFNNYDDTSLQSGVWEKGTTPTYSGETPTKPADAHYTYTFDGWNAAIVPVTANVTYTAHYSSTVNNYTVLWKDEDGTTLETDENVPYGTTPTYDGATPTKATDEEYVYTFAGWTPDLSSVTGDVTYTASYNTTPVVASVTISGVTTYYTTFNPAWTAANSATAASTIKLLSNITAASILTYNNSNTQNCTLDLNGHTISSTQQAVLNPTVSVTFTLTDSSEGKNGKLLSNATATNVAYGVLVSAGTFVMENGTIEAYLQANTSQGVRVANGASFTMEGGTIDVMTTNAKNGDGVFVNTTGTATINGGTIRVNAAAAGYAVENKGSATITDGQFYATGTGSTACVVNTGTLTLHGGYYNVNTNLATYVASPYQVLPNDDATYLYKVAEVALPEEIEVEESQTRTIETNTTATTTTVHVNGTLIVANEKTLTTTDLILEATTRSSGEILGNVVANQHAYFDLSNGAEGFQARKWYAVAVPWQVEVTAYGDANGVYLTNDGVHYTRQKLGSTFDLLWYDGAERALNGPSDACWVYIEDDQLEHHTHYTMLPGRAYMIYLTSDAQTIRFERKQGTGLLNTTAQVNTYYSEAATDANWNGIANPATYHAYMNAASGNKGQIYLAIEDRYEPINDMSETPLVVGQPVFVQSAATKSVVACVDKSDYASHAPRRAQSDENAGGSIEVRIGRTENSYTDRLYISMDSHKEDTYVIGEDLAKAGVSGKVAQMWVERYDARLCANTVFAPNGTAVYPLGISVPQTGEYTIYLPNGENESDYVFLTLNGRVIWNLSYAPYVADLAAGTTNVYGLKRVRNNAPAVTTDTEDLNINEHETVRKYLIDNKVYIMRNGVMYSVTGQKVQ